MSFLVGHKIATQGNPGEVHDTALNMLGARSRDNAGNEYIYLKGVVGTVAGSWVNFDGGTDYSTALLDTDAAATQLGRLAVATAAVVADKYGWYAIAGTLIPAASLTAATDAKNAFATSTAGSVDDSGAGAEVLIFGAFYVSAVDTPSSGLAYFALNYPFMTGLTLD